MKKIVWGIVIIVGIGLISILTFGKTNVEEAYGDADYKILKKWELPKMLNEISGIAWIGDNRIACVQDEDGSLFIYNLATSKVEKVIAFGSGGDYEGVTIINDDAYVLRSDGVIFEVSNFDNENLRIQRHETELHQLKGINIEGICADPDNNRLLLAVKARKDLKGSKEVYAFDLKNKTTGNDPYFKIDFSDKIFKKSEGKKNDAISPGAIGIHPQTGEYYILDGTNPKILIAGKKGKLKDIIMLSSSDFGNPEGLTFSSNGELYISNEAENGPANILLVSLN